MQNKIDAFASKLLSRRNYTEHEFKQKLINAGFDLQAIHKTLEEYLEIGWLNDLNYLESYVHYQSARGIGPVRIIHALTQKGIAHHLIEDNINLSDTIWHVRAREVWKKKFKSQIPIVQSERQKQIRFLTQRGFTQQQILPILRNLQTESNDD